MRLPIRGCAYFLDIDGTLVDLAPTPAHVTLPRSLPALVEALARSSGGAVALISGRGLADIDRLFPGHHWPAAGQHGLERRSASGRVSVHPARATRLDDARRTLQGVVSRHPRLLLEDKGLSLALHYRRALSHSSYVHRVMRSIRASLGSGYRLHHGKRVVELVPAGRNKGAAIAAFMREAPFRGRFPIFIGDDVTDEYGFAVINRLGGCSIKVGTGPTGASWRLTDVRAVRSWLERGHPQPTATPRRSRRPR